MVLLVLEEGHYFIQHWLWVTVLATWPNMALLFSVFDTRSDVKLYGSIHYRCTG
jgi:hypothetical protein